MINNVEDRDRTGFSSVEIKNPITNKRTAVPLVPESVEQIRNDFRLQMERAGRGVNISNDAIDRTIISLRRSYRGRR